jgi:hypothetical protein
MSWMIVAIAIALAFFAFVLVPEVVIRAGARRRREHDPR